MTVRLAQHQHPKNLKPPPPNAPQLQTQLWKYAARQHGQTSRKPCHKADVFSSNLLYHNMRALTTKDASATSKAPPSA